MGLRSSEPHHERTLKSSNSKSTTEREDKPIQNGQTDHLRLQVAVKRGTLLSGEAKDDKVHRGSDARGVFKGKILGMSEGVFFLMSRMMSQYSKWVAKPRSNWAAEKNIFLGVRDRNTETFCQT